MHRQRNHQPHVVVGIDPGRLGAVALLDLTANAPPHWDVFTLPLAGGAVDAGQFALSLMEHLRGRSALVAIEAGINIVGRGGLMHRGISTYLREQGQLVGALRVLAAIGTSCSMTIEEVAPFSWKSHFGICNAGKKGSVDYLVRTSPRIIGSWTRNGTPTPLPKITDGPADAIMIGAYALLEQGGAITS